MSAAWRWVLENKEWVFSGAGVAVVAALVALLKRRPRQGAGVSQKQQTGDGCINTQVGGDYVAGNRGSDPNVRQ